MKTQIFILRSAVIAALLLTLTFGQCLLAQDASPTIYVEITKLKKLNDDLMDLEEELIKPFVQERIKQGNQLFHGLFRVYYPNSDDAAYDYVTLDAYSDFAHLNMGNQKLGEMAYATFPLADIPKMIERFEAAAKNVSSEVFVIRDEAFPGPAREGDNPLQYIVANSMKVSEAHADDYVSMESSIFKPLHQARGKAGEMLDWALLERVMPYGSEWENNFMTFDMYSDWSQLENGGMGDLFETVHPEKDADAVMGKMAEIRDLRRAEVWRSISTVRTPAPEVSYEMVKEGTGPSPEKGQEITFRGTMMDLDGNILFSSAQLGYDFYEVVGSNLYDRFFYKGVTQMKKGGVMKINVPLGAQDKETLNISGGKDIVVKVELLDIGEPKPSGITWLKETIENQGLAAAKEQYSQLQANNPKGYHFREGDMNGLGYQMMRKGNLEAALYLFELNHKNYPKSWNACDSLADGYLAAGNKAKAKEYYEKALKINPGFEVSKNKLEKL